ncbi:cytochrome c-type biogenesis protein [Parapusillimonas sp. JC17]|uniref:cytochrome c-type biogenesis protein n=1 Tax=Parapusillimonas sp. JC17 TaxID=3445768 RepID=UPI003FA0A12F
MTRVLMALILSVISLQSWSMSYDDEKRLLDIAGELRCLVCQNESIAASRADLAVDLRQQIREQIQAGQSDDEIREYMVERYGDFVLYRPPFKATTVLLWFGPILLLLFGFVILAGSLTRRKRRLMSELLSDEERARADALLEQTTSPGTKP